MTRLALALCSAVLFAGVASSAHAGDKIWSVAGVINNGLATVFSCTNGGTASANITVTVFLKNGTQDSTATVSNVVAGASATLGTKPVVALGTLDANMASSQIRGGSATISAPSGVYCTSFVVDPVNEPPSVGWQLTIVAKNKQKGD